MYQIGEWIVYGNTGVCKVADITQKQNLGTYYVLKPLYENGTIYTPAENPKVFMRRVITKKEAEHLIDMIPDVKPQPDHSKNPQELRDHYRAVTNTHNCANLIELAVSIHAKKKTQERLGRKFGQVDEKFMKQTENFLFGELAVALGIEKEQVPDYITNRIETRMAFNT